MQISLREMMANADPIGTWIKECLELSNNVRPLTSSDLLAHFNLWVESRNIKHVRTYNNVSFGIALANSGLNSISDNNRNIYPVKPKPIIKSDKIDNLASLQTILT